MTNISHVSDPMPSVDVKAHPVTSLLRAFPDLLSALDQHIQCERELDEVDLFDPAYATWLDDAEAAQTALYEVLARITRLRPAAPADAPLWRMSLLIATLVREGTASAFRRYAETEGAFVMHLRVPGSGPAALRARGQIVAARERITALATLTFYRQDGDTDGAWPGLCAAAA